MADLNIQLLPNIFRIQKHRLFDRHVWLGLGVSIVCVITVLNVIQRYLQYHSALETTISSNDNPPAEKIITKVGTGKEYLYVFGNLLSQGYNKYKEIKWHNWLADVRRTALISHNFSMID
jgi:hypothetical protein